MRNRTVAITTFIPGTVPEGVMSALIQVAGHVPDGKILEAVRGACRRELEERMAGEPLPYPWCWGDVIETLSDAEDAEGLYRRFGVRVLEVCPDVIVLNCDEPAIHDVWGRAESAPEPAAALLCHS